MRIKYKISIYLFLSIILLFSIGHCARVALIEMHDFAEYFTTLTEVLESDGHTVTYSHSFLPPSDYDVYFLLPSDPPITDDDIAQLPPFVDSGGHLILVPDCRTYIVSSTNRIFQLSEWYDYLGRPRANNEAYSDYVPDTFFVEPTVLPTAFILNFDSNWFPARGIDTLIEAAGVTLSLESAGALQIVGWGGVDAHGEPYVGSSAVYDSYAVAILAGRWGRGRISVVADLDLFSDIWPSSWYPWSFLQLFDNLQFCRQLFATNNRADTCWLEATDTGIVAHLEGSYTPFVADSSEWSFKRWYHYHEYYNGYELGARECSEGIFASYPHIFHDTTEVCLKFLPDITGETVLRRGAVCDTFYIEWDEIEESHIEIESITIDAFPDPFNRSVKISVFSEDIDEIEILDIRGRVVRKLKNRAGSVLWDGTDYDGRICKSGIYFIQAENCRKIEKVLLIR